MPLKRNREIKEPKDLIPDLSDLENDDLPEIDDVEIAPEAIADIDPDEPLDLTPVLADEMSEDPVRLYLREIGQVKLLDSDSEFRLATMIEASRLITTYKRRPLRKNLTQTCGIYHALLADMLTSWQQGMVN